MKSGNLSASAAGVELFHNNTVTLGGVSELVGVELQSRIMMLLYVAAARFLPNLFTRVVPHSDRVTCTFQRVIDKCNRRIMSLPPDNAASDSAQLNTVTTLTQIYLMDLHGASFEKRFLLAEEDKSDCQKTPLTDNIKDCVKARAYANATNKMYEFLQDPNIRQQMHSAFTSSQLLSSPNV